MGLFLIESKIWKGPGIMKTTILPVDLREIASRLYELRFQELRISFEECDIFDLWEEWENWNLIDDFDYPKPNFWGYFK